MFRNYLMITLRSFVNQKYYSLINILGLALGLAACIIIFLYVQDELSYEKSFKNHEKIYRLVQDFPMGDHLSQSATVPYPNKLNLPEYFPEIKNSTLIFRPSSWGQSPTIKHSNELFYEDDFLFADFSLLDIYDFKFISEKPTGTLTNPNELIITESIATKYFGKENPVGRTLSLGGNLDLKVIGVIKDMPENTHLKFNILASFETYRSFFNNNQVFESQWVWVAAWLYFTIESEEDAQRINNGLSDYVANHYPKSLVEEGVSLHIQKADDIHLTSNRELEFKSNGNIQRVYIFSSIAILILFIAIINFMNLATSQSSKRGKEIGLRKAMGANKGMLITQFMGEAMLTVFIALLVAIFIIYNILPWFNELSGKNFSITFIGNPVLLFSLFGLLLVVGVLAGSYPSIVMSSFNPVNVLKGRLMPSKSLSGDFVRKAFVVSQFVVSITLIICIGIVNKQLKYITTMDLGFNQEQVLLADLSFNQMQSYAVFKKKMEDHPDIAGVTVMGQSIPGQEELSENPFIETGKPIEEQQWFSIFAAGHDLEKVLDITFLQGHSFQVGSSVDSAGYIINEAAAAALGWGDDVIGKSLTRLTGNPGMEGIVIGLVKDFHYRPIYDPIKPLVIFFTRGGSKLSIKMKSKNLQKTMTFIENEWNSHFDGTPFRYSFMEMDYKSQYEKEEKLGEVIQYFSILAIFIASLGLLGLSSFSTENRKKEIGIRKVNGASTLELISLLTKDFSKLVFIAFIISIPISYYFANQWLSDFAYRTMIGIPVFIVAGLSALLIAVLTVSFHTVRAALRNPVNSIRDE